MCIVSVRHACSLSFQKQVGFLRCEVNFPLWLKKFWWLILKKIAVIRILYSRYYILRYTIEK